MNEVGLRKTELETPILWVDLDIMERNIAKLSQKFKAAQVNWRPQARVFKTPAIMHKTLAAGAIGIACPKLSEAEVMIAAGIDDVLITNQLVSPQKIARLVQMRRYADVKVAVDDPDNVLALGQAAQQHGVEVGVLVDVNIGNNRTGVKFGQPALELSKLVHETEGLKYLGISGWEGTFIDVADPDQKHQAIQTAIDRLHTSVNLCREAGLPVSIISGGGSVTYANPLVLSAFTEIQAGGAIFTDLAYQSWGVDTEPSLFVQTMVISRPTPDRLAVDAGFKAAPQISGDPRPVNLNGFKQIRMTPEYGMIQLDSPNADIKVGDTFDLVVAYADATVLLHDQLYGIRNGIVEVVWPILGRGKLR